jgi:hypothetical protein
MLMSVTQILDKNISFTSLHQTYHYIQKESNQLAWKYSAVYHNLSNLSNLSDNHKQLNQP